MGFHRRHISAEMLINAYENNGVEGVMEWYRGCDAIVAEMGIASEVTDLMYEEKFDPEETRKKIIKILKNKIENGQ
mgnify:CR=1 FL=1